MLTNKKVFRLCFYRCMLQGLSRSQIAPAAPVASNSSQSGQLLASCYRMRGLHGGVQYVSIKVSNYNTFTLDLMVPDDSTLMLWNCQGNSGLICYEMSCC